MGCLFWGAGGSARRVFFFPVMEGVQTYLNCIIAFEGEEKVLP